MHWSGPRVAVREVLSRSSSPYLFSHFFLLGATCTKVWRRHCPRFRWSNHCLCEKFVCHVLSYLPCRTRIKNVALSFANVTGTARPRGLSSDGGRQFAEKFCHAARRLQTTDRTALLVRGAPKVPSTHSLFCCFFIGKAGHCHFSGLQQCHCSKT